MSAIICREVQDKRELEECYMIRRKIFVQEQALFTVTDRDECDSKALHIIALDESKPVGTVRVYEEKDRIWWGGRLAVLREYRGKAGRPLIHTAIAVVRQKGARRFFANVQKKNVRFFKELGWKEIGNIFLFNEKRHQCMEYDLVRHASR